MISHSNRSIDLRTRFCNTTFRSMANLPFLYGEYWTISDKLAIEMACIRLGGKWTSQHTGKPAGEGLFHHYKEMMRLIWPGNFWTRWDDLMLQEMVEATFLGIAGPSSSGKSHRAACYALCVYWCFPRITTVLVSTITTDKLDMAIWGEIKKYFRMAKERYPGLPGVFIESKRRLTTDGKDVEGREFRAGIVGVACKKGSTWEGLGPFVGCKNEIVILVADDCNLMEPGFLDATANLAANPKFQMFGLGNPNDTTNPFGKLCEPVDGWDTFQQQVTTHAWDTRYRNGRCLRLVGTDSPNLDRKDGLVLYPSILGKRYIDEIASTYGTDSWQYLMWVLAKFPTTVLERRVITRQMCIRFGAFESVVWGSGKLTRIFALDAAYGAVGGDRCVGIEWAFGEDNRGKQTLALIGKPMLIPVAMDKRDGLDRPVPPEDQIALWVKKYCENLPEPIPPDHVAFDGTGRSSLMSAFARHWNAYVVSLEFGGRATDRPCPADPRLACNEVYGKFVSELWFTMRVAIEAEQIRGLTEELVAEGQSRAWKDAARSGSGKSVQDVEPKEETKLRLGRSPDLFDAAVCGLELARRLGFRIGKLDRRGKHSENQLLKLKAEWDRLLAKRELKAA